MIQGVLLGCCSRTIAGVMENEIQTEMEDGHVY